MNLRHFALLSVTFVLSVGFAQAQGEPKRDAGQANDKLQQRLDSFENKLGILFDHTGKDVTMLKRSFDETNLELQKLRDDLERLREEMRTRFQRESERLKEQRRQLQNERAEQEAKAKQARAPVLQPVSLRHSKADDVVKLVRELLQDDAKRIRLAADLRTNTVLIYASREDAELVTSILKLVDRDNGM